MGQSSDFHRTRGNLTSPSFWAIRLRQNAYHAVPRPQQSLERRY
jgi:hypothetical protein